MEAKTLSPHPLDLLVVSTCDMPLELEYVNLDAL